MPCYYDINITDVKYDDLKVINLYKSQLDVWKLFNRDLTEREGNIIYIHGGNWRISISTALR
jgi:hypothetical protein